MAMHLGDPARKGDSAMQPTGCRGRDLRLRIGAGPSFIRTICTTSTTGLTFNKHNGKTTDGMENPLPALATPAEDGMDMTLSLWAAGRLALWLRRRLTENPNISGGVLEAGSNKMGEPTGRYAGRVLVDVGSGRLYLPRRPRPSTDRRSGADDWGHRTVPRVSLFPFAKRPPHRATDHSPPGPKTRTSAIISRAAKVLGGGSAINYPVYVRGSVHDYDDWVELTGDPSWGHEATAPYMRKHQTLEPVDPSTVDEFHGTAGPSQPEDDWIRAADGVTGGPARPRDPWPGDHIAFYQTLATVARTGEDEGKRSYAARDHFAANAQRRDLHVLCDAPVHRVELEGNRATGMESTFGGNRYRVKVRRRQVSVSCGALQTPQILALSGIGDPEVLRKGGCGGQGGENREVGRNLQDPVLTEMEQGISTSDVMHDPDFMAEAQKTLVETQSGPLASLPTLRGFFPYEVRPPRHHAAVGEGVVSGGVLSLRQSARWATRLRVCGTRGLRVVDASVFSNHVSGNLVASGYAVAGRAADLVKAGWEGEEVVKGKL
ncbi:Cellobiose dehydrogenase [Teratosphaeria destructans]|uniref:Cellobiose dehydrogenase n=1 Tax=Teratosphaeria destructans TaxID=418781 RepID=A0A9W7SK29_9PEZI|nr:Cellobiose dehydrogenase [Teratosphaeria destructans]